MRERQAAHLSTGFPDPVRTSSEAVHMLRQRTMRAARRARQTGKCLAGQTAGQVTDLAGSQPVNPEEAFSRAVERFAEQHVRGFAAPQLPLLTRVANCTRDAARRREDHSRVLGGLRVRRGRRAGAED